MLAAVNTLLLRRHGLRVSSIPIAALSEPQLLQLYSLANTMAKENVEHFTVHARSTDLVHVFSSVDTKVRQLRMCCARTCATPLC